MYYFSPVHVQEPSSRCLLMPPLLLASRSCRRILATLLDCTAKLSAMPPRRATVAWLERLVVASRMPGSSMHAPNRSISSVRNQWNVAADLTEKATRGAANAQRSTKASKAISGTHARGLDHGAPAEPVATPAWERMLTADPTNIARTTGSPSPAIANRRLGAIPRVFSIMLCIDMSTASAPGLAQELTLGWVWPEAQAVSRFPRACRSPA